MHPDHTTNVVCDHCGTPFRKKPSHIRPRNYCSNKCRYRRNYRPPIHNGDGTTTLRLTQGYSAIIDTADVARVDAYSWSALVCEDGRVYGFRRSLGRTFYLHRAILDAAPDAWVDHINRNTLDNRRSNLRLVTPAQNGWNRRGERGALSPYKGVTRDGNQWTAQITVNGETHRIGRFNSDVEAARAYDLVAMRLHGEFAHLNLLDD